jgi:hypothetical protein
MSPEEETMLSLLLKKQKEEQDAKVGVSPVLQLVPGGGEKNVWVDILTETAVMARRDELLDFAIVYVRKDSPASFRIRHGSMLPTTSVLAGANVLNQYLVSLLKLQSG